jgi:CheY-like chemotaxis protein
LIEHATILVIDDDEAVRRVLRAILEDAGHRVLEADNGRSGIEHPEFDSAHLVLTDLIMPEQEGLETIRRLRQNYPEKRIIAMSGAYGSQFLDAARLLGAHAVITKPIRAPELLPLLNRVLSGTQT